MTAFNAVRFRVKPGRDQEFLDAHKKISANWPGLTRVNMIKTGDQTYCIIAEWTDMNALANARPKMIATLDSFRDTLEDLGGGLGVTDPISGTVVLALKNPAARSTGKAVRPKKGKAPARKAVAARPRKKTAAKAAKAKKRKAVARKA